MTSTFVAVVLVAFCGTVGMLGYFFYRFIDMLRTEVECMEAVAVQRKKKAERINRAIRTVESAGEVSGEDTGETPTEDVSEDDAHDGFCRASRESGA